MADGIRVDEIAQSVNAPINLRLVATQDGRRPDLERIAEDDYSSCSVGIEYFDSTTVQLFLEDRDIPDWSRLLRAFATL